MSETLTVPLSVGENGAMLDASPPASGTFALGLQETQTAGADGDDTTNEEDSMVTPAARTVPGEPARQPGNAQAGRAQNRMY